MNILYDPIHKVFYQSPNINYIITTQVIKSHEKLITYQTAFKSEMHPKMIPNLLLPFVTNCGAKLMSYFVTYFLLCEDAYNNNDFFSLLSCCEKVGQNVFIHSFFIAIYI